MKKNTGKLRAKVSKTKIRKSSKLEKSKNEDESGKTFYPTDLPSDLQYHLTEMGYAIKKQFEKDPEAARIAFSQTGNYLSGRFEEVVPIFMQAYLKGGQDEFLPIIQLDGTSCEFFVFNISNKVCRMRSGTLVIGGDHIVVQINLPDENGQIPPPVPTNVLQVKGRYRNFVPGEGARFDLDSEVIEIDKLKEQFLHVEVKLDVDGVLVERKALILTAPRSTSQSVESRN